jgi:plasmid stability protein
MRTTIDIPDKTYRALKVRAATAGETVRTIALRALERELAADGRRLVRRLSAPILKSYAPGSINLTNEQIHDLIDLP